MNKIRTWLLLLACISGVQALQGNGEFTKPGTLDKFPHFKRSAELATPIKDAALRQQWDARVAQGDRAIANLVKFYETHKVLIAKIKAKKEAIQTEKRKHQSKKLNFKTEISSLKDQVRTQKRTRKITREKLTTTAKIKSLRDKIAELKMKSLVERRTHKTLMRKLKDERKALKKGLPRREFKRLKRRYRAAKRALKEVYENIEWPYIEPYSFP